jgi:hypothetical protein
MYCTQYFKLWPYESTHFVNTVKTLQIKFEQWDFIQYILRQLK